MENILRRKIDAATGMPPSIVRNARFWEEILQVTTQWGEQNLSGEIGVAFISKKVVSPVYFSEHLSGGLGFSYPVSADGGLCGVLFDRSCGLSLAATRMSQRLDDMGEPSDVFLRLINEGPAESFRAEMNVALGIDESTDQNLPSVLPKEVENSRYLELVLELDCDGTKCRAQLYFECGGLMRRLAAQAEAQNKSDAPVRLGLRKSVQTSKLSIDATLEHIPTTVGTCVRMEVGDVIPLSESDMAKVAMNVRTLSGLVEITSGEVGVWHQNRALRLSAPVSREFLKDLASV